MPTLGELAAKFSQAASEIDNGDTVAKNDGGEKTASEEEHHMTSLADIYMQMTQMDKVAEAGAGVEEAPDFAKLAEQIADAEAAEQIQGGGAEEPSDDQMLKVAAEYEAAGRLMARGFFDEFMKFAAAIDTSVDPNNRYNNPSQTKTQRFGDPKLPHVPTNHAGEGRMDTAGSRLGKDVYKGSLAPRKKIDAGVTGDDPEAAAISIGQGSPAGFATVKDLMGGKPA